MKVRVVVGVCADSGKILMGRRRSVDRFYSGYWEFPGGKIEAGESDVDALKREFDEELGAKVLEAEFLNRTEWDYPGKTVELNFYLVRMNPTQISDLKTEAHDELAWYSADEALNLQLLPANINFINDFKARIH